MKILMTLVLGIFLFGCVRKDKLDQIHFALETGDNFRAQELFEKYKYKLRKVDFLYFTGRLENAFELNERSIETFQKLLSECNDQISDPIKTKILFCQFDNYRKTGDNQKATEMSELLLENYEVYCDIVSILEIRTWLNSEKMMRPGNLQPGNE